ncbi:hypothetical protein ACI3PL_30980, partial [Lacticaseibacillus paracasei]
TAVRRSADVETGITRRSRASVVDLDMVSRGRQRSRRSQTGRVVVPLRVCTRGAWVVERDSGRRALLNLENPIHNRLESP